ncbi:transcription elongation factor GreB [Marinobacterium sediminicola]|uniref:Transcription elongation factor GreB n=1 Tax=Marinobacterium sediminicola TaxID=518898 RepID=A0ABY1S1M9_9GAMM|nr:transcription elongation factor GreB [Marinobacterium sediminicola]ULG69787.1 transcription elongation factor GreB [Marinobacterium sediminicola]SMR75399.1 transcription elongation factor GreB [Marinobacterium sediminicola]
MGRWRPPQPKSSPYITQEGYDRLNEELRYLWKVKRPEVTQSVKEAAAQGDRSENAEYIYGKKQLREIDRRVRYLSKRLEHIKVVDRAPDDTSRIFFGAWVTLLDEEDHQRRYRIVGADEIDPAKGYISIDAPLARQLLKKQVGDEVTIQRGDGDELWLEITGIDY